MCPLSKGTGDCLNQLRVVVGFSGLLWLNSSTGFIATICRSTECWTNKHSCITQRPVVTIPTLVPPQQGHWRLFKPVTCGWRLLWTAVAQFQYWFYSEYLQESGYNSYMFDQASLPSAATGSRLSTHLPLHQGELLDCSGGHPDHYVTHRRPGCGTSGVRRVAKPCTCWIRLR